MADGLLVGIGAAALIGIYADLTFTLVSSFLSSPQTTELFAGQRSETLWKWVVIAGGASLGIGLAASVVAGSPIPLLTMAVIGAGMGVLYYLALRWGQQANEAAPSARVLPFPRSVP